MIDSGEREQLLLEGNLGRAVLASFIDIDPETMATHLGITSDAPIYLFSLTPHRFFRSKERSYSFVGNIPVLTSDQIRSLAKLVEKVVSERYDEIREQLSDSKLLIVRAGRVIDNFAFGSSENWHTFQPALLAAKELLRPVSQLLATNSDLDWWWGDAKVDDQLWVSQRDTWPLSHQKLSQARAENTGRDFFSKLTDEEHTRWWVQPGSDRIADTTRQLVGSALPVKLFCHDDWVVDKENVQIWAVEVPVGTKIYEVHCPSDWVNLVTRFPREYPNPPMGEWLRWTDRSGPWLLPDWKAIAKNYDGVHVSVGGYLSTSYQALPIGDHFTILSGWHPDSTSWLGDAPQIFGEEVVVMTPINHDPYQPLNFNRLNYLPRNGFGGTPLKIIKNHR